ncbi:MAG: flagellar biosynthesis regulator FlaF [Halocynthiibacter sp.]
MAKTAYTQHASHIRSDLDVEYDAIAHITRKIKRATDTDDYKLLVEALHQNRQLWTLFLSAVAEDDNLLPAAVRANIFYLSEFTNIHTSSVLQGTATADALLDINMAVMRGLKQNTELST